MAQAHLSVQIKWWVIPYIRLLYAWAFVWIMCRRILWLKPSKDDVDEWIKRRVSFVEKHGVIPTVEYVS